MTAVGFAPLAPGKGFPGTASQLLSLGTARKRTPSIASGPNSSLQALLSIIEQSPREHHHSQTTPVLFFFPIKLLNKKQKRKQNTSPTKCRKKPCVDEPAPKMSAISHVGWPWDLCSIAPTSHQCGSPWGCPCIQPIRQVWEKTHLQPCNKPAHRSKPCSSAFENLMGKKNNFLWWMQGAVSSAPCHTEVPGNLLPPPGWACWACHEALPS